ncbi:SRPBCC domain-containing protein [Microbacterium sp. NPDC056052]|uniref:SRPBCC domain-containing protein n=1 Tax=Microbacterium sp. NPDC056052 TaxID=3345695 RepID=UPI0035DE1FAB
MPAHPETRGDAVTRPTTSALDVRHDAFTIERHVDAAPEAVFAAFADDTTRRRWFRLPGARASDHHEFRVGGGADATSTFVLPGIAPERLAYHSHYLDIVPDRRIVFSYTSTVDDVPRWASLVTVLFADDETGCLLTWTEQVAFLTRTGDGRDDFPHLRGGTTLRLNGLAAALRADR